MKNYDVVTIGSATLDIMFHTKEAQILKNKEKYGTQLLMAFELGSKVETHDVLYTAGGGAANTAVSFARLGFKTAAITAMGKGATGQIVLDRFKQEKVDLSYVVKLEGYTGMSFVITGGKKGDRVIFVHRSVNNRLEVSKKLLTSFKTKWLYLNSLSGKPWKKNIKNIFEIVKEKGIKIAWNPGSTQLGTGYLFLKPYIKQSEVLLLNREEAISLVRSSGKNITNIPKLFEIMYQWGPKIIAITLGENGAYVCNENKICFAQALPVTGVNTTGAGDAFGSSLVAGLEMYGEVRRALKLAMIRSNHVVREIGAQEGLLSLNQLKKFKI